MVKSWCWAGRLAAAPPPSFLKFVDKLKISGAHSAVNIRQTQPDTLNIAHHSIQTASKRTFNFFLAANGCSIDFPKQCYVCMCMFVWPSSSTKIQYSVQHGLVRLCGHCVYCEAEMAAGECPLQILGIIPQTPNTQHTIFWTLAPENTLQSPTFSAAINEERTSLGASG